MKKSLLSAILLSITWAVSASAVQTPLSAFVRLEDHDSGRRKSAYCRTPRISMPHPGTPPQSPVYPATK